jgi:hypothetical protein
VVVVLAQPVWGFGDYFEAYRFELPCAVPDLLIRIEAFYRWRRIDEVVREQNRLAFIRGSRWATWFSPDERLQPQQVEISVTNDPHAVTCEYTVFNWGPNIFIPPRKLEQEVRRLETFLLANIHRPLQELSRSR